MKTMYFILFSSIILAACSPSVAEISETAQIAQAQTETAAPTTTPSVIPTITPTTTPEYTPTPEFTSVYDSKNQGISIRYPDDWKVSEDEDEIIFEDGDRWVSLYFFPSEAQEQNDISPVAALVSYIQFVGYALPDKEFVHIINLDQSETAFGAYNNPGESPGFLYPRNPLFMTMHFTNQHTIAIEFHAPDGNEIENRKVLDTILASLPPSPIREIIATPTLMPDVSIDLPQLPQGFSWRGVEFIDLALPVPDDWFVMFFRGNEMWQNGLQEYEYQYTITQENPEFVGTFSPALGTMRVLASKNNSSVAGIDAKNIYSNLKTDPNILKIIDEQTTSQGNIIYYQIQAEGINPNLTNGEPGYYQTFHSVVIANPITNTLYFLEFVSPTENWDQEWITGEVMVQMLLKFLEG